MTKVGRVLAKDGGRVKATDGKAIDFPTGNGVVEQVCCQCGLSHWIKVEIEGSHLVMTFYREDILILRKDG